MEHLRLFIVLSSIVPTLPLEIKFQPFFAYTTDELQLTRISQTLATILIFSLLLTIISARLLPIKLTVLMATIIFNIIIYFTGIDYFDLENMAKDITLSPCFYYIYYMPIYIANVCFNCETSDLYRIFPYALLLTVALILMGTFNGYMVQVFTPAQWSVFEMFIYSLTTCSIQPDPFCTMLNNKRFIRLNQLAKGEFIGTLVLCMTAVHLVVDYEIRSFEEFIPFFCIEVFGGAVFGLFVGWLVAQSLTICNDDAMSGFLIILTSMVSAYYCAVFVAVSPHVVIFCMTPTFFKCKKLFSNEANDAIREFFHMSHLLIDLLYSTYCLNTAIFVLVNNDNLSELRLTYCIFGFCIMLLSRTFVYLVLSPVIRLMFSDLDAVVIVINAWASITSNAAFTTCFMFYFSKEDPEFGMIILTQVVFCAIMTNMINPVAMEFLVRNRYKSNFTSDQAANISMCLHEIRSLRVKYIYMWKMKEIMTDARWDIVKKLTNITTIKSIGSKEMIQWRTVTCPDCGREIPAQEPLMEQSEASKNYTKLIKNQIKTILIRRESFGSISPKAAKLAVKLAEQGLTFGDHVQLDLFKRYTKLPYIAEKLYKWEQSTFSHLDTVSNVPRKPYRQKCYYFVRSDFYPYLITLTMAYSITMLALSFAIDDLYSVYFYVVMGLTQAYIISIAVKMHLSINSYAIFSIRQGVRRYFRSVWHWIDAVILFYYVVDLIAILALYIRNDIDTWHVYKYVRLIKLFEVLPAVKNSFPLIIASIEDIIVSQVSLGFEVSMAIYYAYNEMELSMDLIFEDNLLMATETKAWIREDKKQLYQIFTQLQYNYPHVARSIKTRQAMSATMTALNLSLEEFRSAGYVDNWEYKIVKAQLRACELRGYKMEKSWHHMQQREIIRNVPWISSTSPVLQDYLITSCTVKNLKRGEVLCKPGDEIHGIYIILTGIVKIDYMPTTEIISNLLLHGLLPVFKYTDALQYFNPVEHSLVVGNSLGEICVAVNRPCDFTVTALKATKMYYVHRDHIAVAEKLVRDPINGIIAQMWKMTCYNVAIAILKALPKYEFYTEHDIRLKLDSGFVPDLTGYEDFVFLDAIDDVILLHGQVLDAYSFMYYVAPCYLPRSLVRFHLHVTNRNTWDDPKLEVSSVLMIIPMQDIDQYSVMMLENQVAELKPGRAPLSRGDGRDQLAQGRKMAGFSSLRAVTQGSHLTKFINLKK